MGPGQPAVKALMSEIIATDDSYPTCGTAQEKKNYHLRFKRAAVKELFSKEAVEQRKKLTMLEHTERYKAMRESCVLQHLLERARASLTEETAGTDDSSDAQVVSQSEPQEDFGRESLSQDYVKDKA